MDARQRLKKLERDTQGPGQAPSARQSGADDQTTRHISEEEGRRIIREMSRPIEEERDDTK